MAENKSRCCISIPWIAGILLLIVLSVFVWRLSCSSDVSVFSFTYSTESTTNKTDGSSTVTKKTDTKVNPIIITVIFLAVILIIIGAILEYLVYRMNNCHTINRTNDLLIQLKEIEDKYKILVNGIIKYHGIQIDNSCQKSKNHPHSSSNGKE